MRETSAIEATIQGMALVARSGADRVIAAPTGAPQEWQNLAPGVSADAQVLHVAPSSGAPQLAQNRPSAAAPHEGHMVVVGAGMEGMYFGGAEGAEGAEGAGSAEGADV